MDSERNIFFYFIYVSFLYQSSYALPSTFLPSISFSLSFLLTGQTFNHKADIFVVIN